MGRLDRTGSFATSAHRALLDSLLSPELWAGQAWTEKHTVAFYGHAIRSGLNKQTKKELRIYSGRPRRSARSPTGNQPGGGRSTSSVCQRWRSGTLNINHIPNELLKGIGSAEGTDRTLGQKAGAANGDIQSALSVIRSTHQARYVQVISLNDRQQRQYEGQGKRPERIRLPVHSQDHKNCLEQPRFRCNRRLSAPALPETFQPKLEPSDAFPYPSQAPLGI